MWPHQSCIHPTNLQNSPWLSLSVTKHRRSTKVSCFVLLPPPHHRALTRTLHNTRSFSPQVGLTVPGLEVLGYSCSAVFSASGSVNLEARFFGSDLFSDRRTPLETAILLLSTREQKILRVYLGRPGILKVFLAFWPYDSLNSRKVEKGTSMPRSPNPSKHRQDTCGSVDGDPAKGDRLHAQKCF